MKARLALALCVVFLLAAAVANAQTYGAVLTPGQEVPPTTSNGFGNATVTLDPTHTMLTVSMTVSKLTGPLTLSHIHKITPGQQTGPVVIDFMAAVNFLNNKLNATFTIPKTTGDDLVANLSQYYVNVHTAANPGGEIRGALSPVSGVVTTFAGELRGTNEVPPNSSTAVGAYFLTFDSSNLTLTWDVTSNVTNPTLSHIHQQAAGMNGSVIISFATSASAFTNGRTKGSIQLDAATFANILANPAGFYVNVHSMAFGGGEVRGQLSAGTTNEYDIGVAGNVTNGIGQHFVTDVRVFNPSYDTPYVALVEYFTAGLSANTNASATTVVNIAPRACAVLDDVAGAGFLNQTGTTGGMRVSAGSNLAVTSRIYNDLRSSGGGTLGQDFPGVPHANALRRGVIPQLSNSGFRTNVGFFNPNSSSVIVRLEVRDNTGAILGSTVTTLQALSQQQSSIGSYFNGVDLTNKANMIMTFDASAPIVAYGSIVDNTSSDQTAISAQLDSGVATAP
jgi:Cu/Zn superoxide dismutase